MKYYPATEQAPQPCPRRHASGSARRNHRRIDVEPTPERQTIYNRIRDEVKRQQQHGNQQLLRPPSHRATPMSRTSSENRATGGGGTSPSTALGSAGLGASPDTGGEPARRPRGRRGGPLDTDTRLKTALRRALKLVCDECRSRKVACDCHDLSQLEDAYRASHGSSSTSAPRRPSRGSPNVRSSPRRAESDFLGFNNSEPMHIPPDIDDSDLDESSSLPQPAHPRPDVQRYASQFNADTLLPGFLAAPTLTTTYNPGLEPTTEDATGFLAAAFPVGSEIAESTGQWHCEFAGETCQWTGPVEKLSQHWKTDHHPIRQTEQWCECTRCLRIRMGWDKPYLCLDEACSPRGAVWKRWLYGHTLVESTVASTPALTQSGESENGSFDQRGPRDAMAPGSQDGSFSRFDSYSNSSSFGYQHGSGYRKEYHSIEDGGDLSGGAQEHKIASSSGLPASKCRQSAPQYDSNRTRETRPPRMDSWSSGCRASHPSFNWAKKMRQIICTVAASVLATAVLDPRCFMDANAYVAHSLSTALSMPWVSLLLICCGFAVTWLVQTWSAAHQQDPYAAPAPGIEIQTGLEGRRFPMDGISNGLGVGSYGSEVPGLDAAPV